MPARTALLLLFLLLLAGCTPAPTTPAARPVADKPGAPVDPYPESPAVRQWLTEHVNDPSLLEITWVEREEITGHDTGGLPRGTMRIDVQYRTKNQFGAVQLYKHAFFVHDGKLWLETAIR